jgi:hypothetical protein
MEQPSRAISNEIAVLGTAVWILGMAIATFARIRLLDSRLQHGPPLGRSFQPGDRVDLISGRFFQPA